jgi:hypothetical protein
MANKFDADTNVELEMTRTLLDLTRERLFTSIATITELETLLISAKAKIEALEKLNISSKE